MNFFKKNIGWLILAAFLMGLFCFSNTFLENELRGLLSEAALRLAQRDIYLTSPGFDSAALTGPNSFVIKNFKTGILPRHSGRFSGAQWMIDSGETRVEIFLTFFRVTLKNFHLDVEGKGEFRGSFATADLPFSAEKIMAEAKNIMTTGVSHIVFDVSGELKAQVAKDFLTMHISTEKSQGVSSLVMDRKDVLRIARDTNSKLNEAEIDLIVHHPIQAPRLAAIKNYAENTAAAAHKATPIVPEGSYRHVLWSYLLTREFGAKFAKEVTDAHETGDVELESGVTHLMDFHNNATGARYAEEGIPESQVLPRLLRDSRVFRKD